MSGFTAKYRKGRDSETTQIEWVDEGWPTQGRTEARRLALGDVTTKRANLEIRTAQNTLEVKDSGAHSHPDKLSNVHQAGIFRNEQDGVESAEMARRLCSRHQVPAVAHGPEINEEEEEEAVKHGPRIKVEEAEPVLKTTPQNTHSSRANPSDGRSKKVRFEIPHAFASDSTISADNSQSPPPPRPALPPPDIPSRREILIQNRGNPVEPTPIPHHHPLHKLTSTITVNASRTIASPSIGAFYIHPDERANPPAQGPPPPVGLFTPKLLSSSALRRRTHTQYIRALATHLSKPDYQHQGTLIGMAVRDVLWSAREADLAIAQPRLASSNPLLVRRTASAGQSTQGPNGADERTVLSGRRLVAFYNDQLLCVNEALELDERLAPAFRAAHEWGRAEQDLLGDHAQGHAGSWG